VPTLEIPPLARSVYFTTRENQVIREDLYSAVAVVLAFVMSLETRRYAGTTAIDVPMHMRFDAEGRPELVASLNPALRNRPNSHGNNLSHFIELGHRPDHFVAGGGQRH
jgi:hypothetical protein